MAVKQKLTLSHLLVVLYAIGSSFILIFATLLKRTGMSSVEMVFFRISISLILILAYIRLVKRDRGRLLASKKDLPFFIIFGLFFAAFLLVYVSSVSLGASVVVAGALVYTQPVFTAIISRITGKEKKLNDTTILAIILSVVGAVIVSGIFNDINNITSVGINAGLVLAFLSGLAYASFLAIKRHAQEKGYTALRTVFNQLLFATPAVVILGFLLRFFVTRDALVVGLVLPNIYQTLLAFGFAVICTAVPYAVLAAVKNKEVSPVTEGVLLSFEPMLVSILAFAFLGQTVKPIQYAGVALIVASTMLLTLGFGKKK